MGIGRIGGIEFAAKELQDVLELDGIGGIGLGQSLMGLQHGLFLGIFGGLGAHLAEERVVGGLVVVLCGIKDLDGKELVETEAGKEIGIALVDIGDAQLALSDLAETESGAGESAHESGIHLLAVLQIDNELTKATLDHLLDEFLEPRAVLKAAPALHSDPSTTAHAADEDG